MRIICATNRNLLSEVMEKNFREDLYYRLNVINFRIPPLRERKEDILLLFSTFLTKNSSVSEALSLIDPEVLDALVRYDWPGNVRELQNVAERMLYLSGGDTITSKYLPQHIIDFCRNTLVEAPDKESVRTETTLENSAKKFPAATIAEIRRLEKEQRLTEENRRLTEALRDCHGNVAAAARKLGISRATFYRKLKLAKLEEDTNM